MFLFFVLPISENRRIYSEYSFSKKSDLWASYKESRDIKLRNIHLQVQRSRDKGGYSVAPTIISILI